VTNKHVSHQLNAEDSINRGGGSVPKTPLPAQRRKNKK
jgi:hypothetical protein